MTTKQLPTIEELDRWHGGAEMPCPFCGEAVQEGDDCQARHYAAWSEQYERWGSRTGAEGTFDKLRAARIIQEVK